MLWALEREFKALIFRDAAVREYQKSRFELTYAFNSRECSAGVQNDHFTTAGLTA
jgi:hypothetical protein